MRICFIGNFTGGGTESATFLVANGLKEQYEIFLINTCKRKPTFYLRDGIEMEYLSEGNIPKRILNLAGYLKKNKIDILVIVEAMTGILSIPAVKLAHCKHIVWEHANYFQNQGTKHIQRIRQIELKTADAYVVLTKRDLFNFKEHFKVKVKMDYIYNIASKQSDKEYDINSKTIISAGHIRKIKNFIVIPDIARIVFAKHPDWCWKIYGATQGEEYEKLAAKVKAYGLQDKIIFCGRCNNMETEYGKAAIYVMTSLQEGLPMVLLEAKSNKLPLVSFDIETGPDEIIRNGINGYLVPSYDIKIMAEKICTLIENDGLREDFSKSSSLDLEKFSCDVVINHWKKLIEEM